MPGVTTSTALNTDSALKLILETEKQELMKIIEIEKNC